MEKLFSRNNLMLGAVLVTLFLVWKSTGGIKLPKPAETTTA